MRRMLHVHTYETIAPKLSIKVGFFFSDRELESYSQVKKVHWVVFRF